MRVILFIFSVVYFSSCINDQQNYTKDASAGIAIDNILIPNSQINTKASYLLCDFLIGEDPNGTWTIITNATNSTLIESNLIGDCPNIDFNNFGCGNYTLRYTVESTTCTGCTDFADVNIYLPCCNISPPSITMTCN